MAYASYAEFIAFLPEFATLTQAFVELWLEETKNEIDSAIRKRQHLAHVYLTAHRLALTPAGKAAAGSSAVAQGPITSKKAGDLTITYATTGGSGSSGGSSSSGFGATSYGQQYEALRSSIVIPGIAL